MSFLACALLFVFVSAFRAPELAGATMFHRIFNATVQTFVTLALIMLVITLLQGVLLGMQKLTGVVCEHTLEITDEGLIEETTENKSLQKWTSFAPTVHLRRHVLVRPNDTHFHIIPRREIDQATLDSFLSALESSISAARKG